MWGVADIVREGIKAAKYAPGHTIGAHKYSNKVYFSLILYSTECITNYESLCMQVAEQGLSAFLWELMLARTAAAMNGTLSKSCLLFN